MTGIAEKISGSPKASIEKLEMISFQAFIRIAVHFSGFCSLPEGM